MIDREYDNRFVVSDILSMGLDVTKHHLVPNVRQIRAHIVTPRVVRSSSNEASCRAKLSLGNSIHSGV
jgi:hypothetical protein